MANTIEILIKARDEASAVLQRTATSTSTLASVLPRIATGLGVIGAVGAVIGGVGAAVFNAGKSLADYAEQLNNLAVRTGATVQQVQVLRQTLINAGLGADAANQALTFLNRAIATQDPLLRALGITTTNAYDALIQLGDAFEASTDTAAKNEIAFKLLGRSGAEIIPVLEGLRAKTDEVRKIYDETGATLTEDTQRQLAELDAKADEFATRWDGFMVRVKGSAASAALGVLEAFDAIKKTLSDAQRGAFGGGGLNALRRFGAAPSPVDNRTTEQAAAAQTNLAKALAASGEKAAKQRKDVETLTEALRKAGLMADTVAGKFNAAFNPSATADGVGPRFGLGVPPLPQPVDPQFGEQIEKFGEQVQEELRNVNQTVNDLLFAVESGLTFGFQNAFQNILTGAQTFGSAIKGVFQSIVSEILAMLARLAAAAVFKLFLNLFTGGAAGAAAGAAVGGGGAAQLSAVATGGARVSGGARTLDRNSETNALLAEQNALLRQLVQTRGGDTINISALDFKTVYDSLVAPGGASRRANDRIGELAAVA